MASMLIRHGDEALHTRLKASAMPPMTEVRRTTPALRVICLPAEWLQPTAAQGGKIQC